MTRNLVFSFRDANSNGSPIEQKDHLSISGLGLFSLKELQTVQRLVEEQVDITEGIETGDIKPRISDPTGTGQLEAYRAKKQHKETWEDWCVGGMQKLEQKLREALRMR